MERYEFIRDDVLHTLNFTNINEKYMSSPRFDRIDYFHRIGAYNLKLFVDYDGFWLPEKQALHVNEVTEIPIIPRDWIFRSEHESYISSQASNLSEDWLE